MALSTNELPVIVFDYDGTIHETMKIYEPACKTVFYRMAEKGVIKDFNIPREKISSWLGMNTKEMWEDFMPELPQEDKEKYALEIGEEMKDLLHAGKASWYEGTEMTLFGIKMLGYRMVILSNCKKDAADEHWKAFNMYRFFDKWYDCESFNYAPKTEIIKQIQRDYRGKSLIVVGDRRSDLEAAKATESLFVGCDYGYGTPGELSGADAVAKNITEVGFIFNTIKNNA